MTNLTLATPKSVVRFSALSLLTAALLATPFRSAAEVSDFQYVTNNGTLTITRYTGTASSLLVPAEINGLPVTGIGDQAFYGNIVWNIEVPSGVTWIGSNAFDSSFNLVSVKLADTVRRIGYGAFRACEWMRKVNLPEGLTQLEGELFWNCSRLTDIRIPATVTNIGPRVFFGSAVTNIVVPDSVLRIEEEAFANCLRMTNMTVGMGLTGIGSEAFGGCTRLAVTFFYGDAPVPDSPEIFGTDTNIVYYMPATSGWGSSFAGRPTVMVMPFAYAVTNGAVTITSYHGPGGTVKIPPTIDGLPVVVIGNGAFAWRSTITNVVIPDSITNIGNAAFMEAPALSRVSIGSNVTSIGSAAFGGCASMSELTVDPSNPAYTSVDGVLFTKNLDVLLTVPGARSGSYTVPASVFSVADKCFSHCAGLTNVFLSRILTNIGPYAFESCFALERLEIPDSVRTIGDFAFAACVKLVEANLPLNLTSIPRSLFEGCLELSALNIPDQVTNIGGFAFASMNSLTNVTIPASVAFISMLPFDSCSNLRAVYFRGNAPTTSGGLTFWNSPQLTNVYYLPGMTGWGPTFSDLPTALWLPSIKTDDAQFGIQGSAFGFNVQWAKGMTAVIEARDGFESGYWSGVKTNVFVTDLLHFSDESWEDSPHRIYRVRWQKQTSQFGQR